MEILVEILRANALAAPLPSPTKNKRRQMSYPNVLQQREVNYNTLVRYLAVQRAGENDRRGRRVGGGGGTDRKPMLEEQGTRTKGETDRRSNARRTTKNCT